MKRSYLKRKTPLRPSGFSSLKRSRIRVAGKSDASTLKREIQDLLRQIALLRDKTCVLEAYRPSHTTVMQFDHLITRANSATYADSRLGVLICSGCHLWKKYHQKEYDEIVRGLLSKDRVELWDRYERDSWRPVRTGAHDWQMWIVVLKKELSELQSQL